jgi:hypothetical protein
MSGTVTVVDHALVVAIFAMLAFLAFLGVAWLWRTLNPPDRDPARHDRRAHRLGR